MPSHFHLCHEIKIIQTDGQTDRQTRGNINAPLLRVGREKDLDHWLQSKCLILIFHLLHFNKFEVSDVSDYLLRMKSIKGTYL